ncbi:MAG: YggT family protein [Candidatus Coatesbacteria bacterium]|nr:YggT family protein [Candidatus Coatesbacteria bacterium]
MKFLGIIIGLFYHLINLILNLYLWTVLIRVVISWIEANRYNPIVVVIYKITDPPLRFISRYIPCRFYNIDFSPFILTFLVILVQSALKLAYNEYVIPLFK